MKTLKKKILFSFLLMVILSIVCAGSAFAGVSISGNSNVYPGKTYTYTVKVTAKASSMMGTAKSSGVGGSSTSTWSKDSSTGYSQNLSATCKVTVKIPSNAALGSTGKITVAGTYSTYTADGGVGGPFKIAGSKTFTVVAPPTPPPPTKWELAVKEIKKQDYDSSLTVEMNPEKEKELNAPKEAFEAIKDKNVTLTVDFGTFKCILAGADVGEIPDGMEDVNLGYMMLPAERPTDMLVFTPNNTMPFRYAATYVIAPNLELPEDMIYVYRHYPYNGKTEYIDEAKTDEDGNVLVYVFAPGQYIVSNQSIEGTIGNMDMAAFIEMFATPTPEPTAEPTPVPTPSPAPKATATPEPEKEMASGAMTWLTIVLGALVVALLAAIIISKRKQKVSGEEE